MTKQHAHTDGKLVEETLEGGPVRPDIPDAVLASAWSPAVQTQYKIDKKAFYATRHERGVPSVVRKGPKRALDRPGVDIKHLGQAVDDDIMGRSTAENYKTLKRASDTDGHKASKLAILYPGPKYVPWRQHANSMLVSLFTASAFLREFARVGVDPLTHVIQWHSDLLPVEHFLRIIKAVNPMAISKPSLHQSVFSHDRALSMHCHNFFIRDDNWYQDLRKLLDSLEDAGVHVHVQTQIVSFLTTFNHTDVMHAFADADVLPICKGQDAYELNRSCKELLLKLLAANKDIFSIRFDTTLYNTCHGKCPSSEQVSKTIGAELKRVLSFAEAAGLASAPTYLEKLELLSARKGYSSNLEESFTGKNLINIMAGLGKERVRFAPHATHSKTDHPDGPGARAFYSLFLELEGSRETRAYILRHCRAMWPTDVKVDGCTVTDLHLGWSGLEVDDETVQYWSCACARLCNYMLTGKIPRHLRRKPWSQNQ